MKLLVDVDGVCANFVEAYAALATRVCGVDVPTIAAEWDWDVPYIGKEGRKRVWEAIEAEPAWWLGLKPLPGAEKGLCALHRLARQHDIYFVTYRHANESKRMTELWLGWWGFPEATVVVTQEKAVVAKALRIEKGIEDLVPTAVALRAVGVEMSVMRHPYTVAWDGVFVDSVADWVERAVCL
jgi:hypothetical protein